MISVTTLPKRIQVQEHFEDTTKRDHLFDHLEVYKTTDKRIVSICSIYESIDQETSELMVLGWKKIYPMYYNQANTYMKWIV